LNAAKEKNAGRARIDTAVLPHSVMGYVGRFTGRHQIVLALLSIYMFLLSTVPLELQRRIVNDAIKKGMTETAVVGAFICRRRAWRTGIETRR
jgi:hypothetical protein